jgi:hypothetical protein
VPQSRSLLANCKMRIATTRRRKGTGLDSNHLGIGVDVWPRVATLNLGKQEPHARSSVTRRYHKRLSRSHLQSIYIYPSTPTRKTAMFLRATAFSAPMLTCPRACLRRWSSHRTHHLSQPAGTCRLGIGMHHVPSRRHPAAGRPVMSPFHRNGVVKKNESRWLRVKTASLDFRHGLVKRKRSIKRVNFFSVK